MSVGDKNRKLYGFATMIFEYGSDTAEPTTTPSTLSVYLRFDYEAVSERNPGMAFVIIQAKNMSTKNKTTECDCGNV